MTLSREAFAVIMAGGRGERFWPESRIARPKQLLKLFGRKTLLEETVERIAPLFAPEKIVIVTNSEYADAVRTLLPSLPKENVIGEPALRDTAPCIAMAAAFIESRSPDAVMCVLPSDHVINDSGGFRKVISECLAYASENASIVTVGIHPAYPATGYGYIETAETLHTGFTKFRRGVAFKEKPSAETAAAYIESGRFKWNGGMFVMSLPTLNAAFKECDADIAAFKDRLTAIFGGASGSLAVEYDAVKRISIDYAVMEKAHNIVVADSRFDWDDAGSWTTFRNQLTPDSDGNVSRGLFAGIDAKDCITASDDGHLIAAIDVSGLAVIHTADVTLVCPAERLQRIKELIKKLSADPELKKFL